MRFEYSERFDTATTVLAILILAITFGSLLFVTLLRAAVSAGLL